jgi:hypothetical protein
MNEIIITILFLRLLGAGYFPTGFFLTVIPNGQ